MWKLDTFVASDGESDHRAWLRHDATGLHILVQIGHQSGGRETALEHIDRMLRGLNHAVA